jgi:hypothetical protein
MKPMDREPLDSGRIFTASLLIAALTTNPTSIMSLVASSLSRVEILKLEMQQISTLPQAASVELWRGTGTGSTGTALVPANRNGWPTAQVSTSVVNGNSTVLDSTVGATRVHAGGFEVDSGKYCYEPCLPPVVDFSQRFSARISAPSTAAALPLAATLTFRETGRFPG